MTTLEFLKDMREDTPVEWKELDEAIAELEALQSRSCYTCKWKNIIGKDEPCDECSESYHNKWEA